MASQILLLVTSVLLTVSVAAAAEDRPQPAALPSLSIDPKGISVSGVSAGGFMATQLLVAHSSRYMGAGIVAGGLYYCMRETYIKASYLTYVNYILTNYICRNSNYPPSENVNLPKNGPHSWVSKSKSLVKEFQESKKIDRIEENFINKRIYFFSGGADFMVGTEAVQANKDFFAELGVPEKNMKFDKNKNAAHAFISKNEGHGCGNFGPPYINRCSADDGTPYDQAGEIFKHIYGLDASVVPAPKAKGRLLSFDQTLYAAPLKESQMDEAGHLYIPPGCDVNDHNACKLHVSLHGCAQNQHDKDVGQRWYSDLGFNEWADVTRTVILYPQVANVDFFAPNCWDWWGYTGKDYAVKDGPQIKAINNMIDALAGREPNDRQ